MQGILVTEHGGPDVLVPSSLPEPVLEPDQILVEVAAAGVNFIDVYHRTGLYPLPLPFTPGGEGAGGRVSAADSDRWEARCKAEADDQPGRVHKQ